MEIIKVGTDDWQKLKDEILLNYKESDLITKEWLRDKFCIEKEDTITDIKTYCDLAFVYMDLVKALKQEILVENKVCLGTVWGQGLRVIPAEDTVQYGYDEFIDDVKKAAKKATCIFLNAPKVSLWRQSFNNDIIAKFEGVKMMIKGLKK